MRRQKEQNKQWYKLDNAALLYPGLESNRLTSLFRVAATLKSPVEPPLLQKALEHAIERFPYYRVTLKMGMFWYFLEHNPKTPHILRDDKYPMQRLKKKETRGFSFRVRYYNNRIAVEMHHSITDGTGGLTFLNCILGEYFRLQNIKFPYGYIKDPKEKPDNQESCDAFGKFYRPATPYQDILSQAYHLPHSLIPSGRTNIITGEMSVEDVKTLAHEYNASITEYLASVMLYALQEIQRDNVSPKRYKPIRISIPVNLRKLFQFQQTMRNFSLYVIAGIDPRLGEYSFEEIVDCVKNTMKSEINVKSISRQLARNVDGSKNFLVRIIPMFIKKNMFPFLFRYMGERQYSATLSNLGNVTIPQELASYIESYDFMVPPNHINKSNCGVISYNGKMRITFNRTIDNSDFERLFFTFLRRRNVHITVESN